jgi:trimeric autotransporter adhesin
MSKPAEVPAGEIARQTATLRFCLLPLVVLLASPVRLSSQTSYTITTIAGDGTEGFSGDNGQAINAAIGSAQGVAVDSAGNIYIADTENNRVRKVSGGVITTIAGDGTQNYGGDGGPATSAQLNRPFGVAVDPAGTVYFADYGNNAIRKVANGVITTIVGGFTNFAAGTQLNSPNRITLDSAGNLYIADTYNHRVLKFANGTVTTVAGNGTAGFSGDGGPGVSAQLSYPGGVAVDSAGDVYVADSGNDRIRRISGGAITTVVGNGGDGFSGDGGPALSAMLHVPSDVAVDSAGNLYIADFSDYRIRKVSNGVITTIAGIGYTSNGYNGDGGPAASAALNEPVAVVVDASGKVYIADEGNFRIRLLTPNISASGPLTVTTSSLPNGSADQAYSPVTLTATGGSGSYVWTATGLPAGLTLSTAGLLGGTPANAGSFTVTFSVTSAGTSTSATLSLTVGQPLPLQIPASGGSAIALPPATVLIPYSETLGVLNGLQPYSWSIIGGALPEGLALSSSGLLAGVPSQPGSSVFTARVTDSSGASTSGVFSITVSPQPLAVTTTSLPNGITGSAYPAAILNAAGGNPPYVFQIAGTLPAGLSFASGVISGIPTASGTFNLSVTVTDSSSPAQTATGSLQLTIQPAHTDLVLSQSSVSFSLFAGAGGLPAAGSVTVRSNAASQILSYSVAVSPAVSWLDVTGGGLTPGVISVSLDPSALAFGAGVSNTSIVVTCLAPSPCAGNSQTINVSLTVTSAVPQLALSASVLSFTASSSSPQPVSQSLGLQDVGGGTITVVSVTAANSYISIANVPANVSAGPGSAVDVTVNPAGLAAGFYQSSILVNTSAGSVGVPVTLLVSPNPTMTLNPAGTQFLMQVGGAPGNPNGSFDVSVSGSTVSWTAAVLPGAPWLTLNTSSGTSTAANPGTVGFSVNSTAAVLGAQAYYAAIQVSSTGVVDSPLTFVVVLNVAPLSSPTAPNPTPAGVLFIANGNGTPPTQTVQVFVSSSTPQTYQASSDSPWLTVSPTTGPTSTSSPASSSVSVDLSGLAAGVYRGNASYALSSADVRSVNVTLIVEAGAVGASNRVGAAPRAGTTCVPAHLVPTETGLVNSYAQAAGWPTPLTVLVVNDCGQPVTNAQVAAVFSNGDPPLALNATDSTSGVYSGTWTPLNVSQQVTITASVSAAGFPTATVQISGQVTPNAAPILTQNGTVDAFAVAAEAGLPLAPGTIVQIYGSNLTAHTTSASSIPLPTVLDQTSVIIGGLMAPLYYVSPGQINAQVPFELQAGSPYQVVVSTNGALSTPNPIQLTSDAPGIAQYAAGQVIAQHLSDNSLITETSPAMPGEYVVFYAAGMGLTSPAVSSGTASPSINLPALLDTPTLTLNGLPVTNILFAGLTPTLVGLYQVDFQVPGNAPNGDLPMVLTQTSGQTASAILPVHN